MRGSGCVYRRAGRDGWAARVKVNGAFRYRSGFSTKSMAQAWMGGELTRAETAEVLGIEPVQDDLAFESALPRWRRSLQGRKSPRTIKGYEEVTDRILLPYFRGRRMADITPRVVGEFETRMIEERGVSGATLNRYRTVLSSIFQVGVAAGLVRENPTRGMQRAREAVRPMEYLGLEEELRLFAAMPVWLRVPCLLSLDTGLREGEILGLDVRDAHLGRRPPVVVVRTSKNYQPREVGLTARSVQALAAHIAALPRGAEPLFLEEDGKTRLRKATLWNAFRAARRRAKLPTFRFHDFRHMYGTRLAEAGAPPARIKAALGHKSLAATMRYIDHAPEDAARTAGQFLDQARAVAAADAERKRGQV
jgi:integrase